MESLCLHILALTLVINAHNVHFTVHSFTTPRPPPPQWQYYYNHRCNQHKNLSPPTNNNNIIKLHLSQRNSDEADHDGIRLNKVFKATHSRREADKLIESGRVCVNGQQVLNKGGMKVIPYQDEVSLDGKVIRGWEQMNAIIDPYGGQTTKSTEDQNSNDNRDDLNTGSFEYVKYFKPLGVICTTDSRINGNIIDEIRRDGYNPKHRVYPVGRLDKETTGLIVLTSDGRMVNSVLRGEQKQPKVYKVMVNGRLDDEDLQQLRVSA